MDTIQELATINVADDPEKALRDLAQRRKEEALAAEVVASYKKGLEENPAFAAAKKAQAGAKQVITLLTEGLKKYYVERFTRGADVHPAFKKRETSTIEVDSLDDLLAWARVNMPAMIVTTINQDVLEAYVKAMQKTDQAPPPGVKVVKKIEMTLASDLTPFVGE